jgi:hypothetical protein
MVYESAFLKSFGIVIGEVPVLYYVRCPMDWL